MDSLTLETALALTRSALSHVRTEQLAPLSVVVVDSGGRLKAALREDEAGLMGVDIALAKARGALTFGMSSRAVGEIFGSQPGVMAALAQTVGGQVLPLAGALLIFGSGPAPLGAIGAAGDLPDRDEAAVRAALASAGLRGEPMVTHS